MSLQMPALLFAAIVVAILVHRRLSWYPLACAVATFCTTLPGLLVFEASGAARTDFMPFTVAVLVFLAVMVSALVGLPFYLWRWHKGVSMPRVDLPRGISWSMLGGMLCGVFVVVLPVMLQRPNQDLIETLMLTVITVGVLGSIVSAFAGTAFLAAMVIAGGHPASSRKSRFQTGAALSTGVSACMAVAPYLVPQSWGTLPANKLMALQLNLALLLPAAAGWICGRRQRAATAAADPMAAGHADGPARSKVSDTAGPAQAADIRRKEP